MEDENLIVEEVKRSMAHTERNEQNFVSGLIPGDRGDRATFTG